jgi:hypothetical protein
MKFEPGDIVVCICDGGSDGFTKNKEYVVSQYIEKYVNGVNNWLRTNSDNNGKPNGWLSRNFVLKKVIENKKQIKEILK